MISSITVRSIYYFYSLKTNQMNNEYKITRFITIYPINEPILLNLICLKSINIYFSENRIRTTMDVISRIINIIPIG